MQTRDIPSSPPKKLLPAFPAMGKFVAGETTGITHVYRDESDDVLVPGIMSSSPVKRSHVVAFKSDTDTDGSKTRDSNRNTTNTSSPSRATNSPHSPHSPPPSSPCPRVDYSSDNDVVESSSLQSILTREPRAALTSLPIVSLIRPSANRVNQLIMEKRVHSNADLLTKPSPQELLAIMGEFYPPVAIGRSSLQSQVVLSRSNRQISRRHVTTWYDLDRHVIAIACSGWNGCRVMSSGRVFRTADNIALLEEAKVKYGDIFEPSRETQDGQENAKSGSAPSFGTFLFKNDRMEVDASEIVVDVRGERFMVRLSDEGEQVADEDAEMTTDETDDEELVPLQKKSDNRLNRAVEQNDVHIHKKQKVEEVEPMVKPKATTPSTPVDKENATVNSVTSATSATATPATVSASASPAPATFSPASKRSKPNNKPVLKTVKVMKPVARQSVVRQVSRPAGRLEKPQMLKREGAVKEAVAEKAAVESVKPVKPVKAVETKPETKPEVKKAAVETKPEVNKTDKTETKAVEKAVKAAVETIEKPATAKPANPIATAATAANAKPIVTAATATAKPATASPSTRETTPVPQLSKTTGTPKSTPKAVGTPKGTPKSTPRKAKSPSPEIPLSPSQIDLKAIRNLVCNHLAFSRLSCTPLQTVMAVSPKISIVPKTQLQQILRDIDCVGIIHREGKDASGKPLEEEYYYVPERDSDQDRVKLVNETKGGAGVRSCRKVHKQYYWKKPTL